MPLKEVRVSRLIVEGGAGLPFDIAVIVPGHMLILEAELAELDRHPLQHALHVVGAGAHPLPLGVAEVFPQIAVVHAALVVVQLHPVQHGLQHLRSVVEGQLLLLLLHQKSTDHPDHQDQGEGNSEDGEVGHRNLYHKRVDQDHHKGQ